MKIRLALALGSIALLAGPAAAQQLDWEVVEAPAGPALTWARGARDGVVGLLDCAADLQLGAFSELALVSGALLMGVSDLVGLVDDNPVSQHVFKGVASKSLAKTAYLLHLAGGEAILGSHGLETEWYVERELAELNPLLAGEETAPPLPLEPLAFVEEGLVHTDVYRAHLPGSILLASALADGLLRPAGNLVRIAGAHSAAERIESFANGLVRSAVECIPDRLAQLALVHGRAVLAAIALLTLALGAGYARLPWTDDPEVLALEGSDELDFYREFVARWGSDELIVLGWEVPDAFAPAELERLRALSDALFELDGVAWVSSLDTAFTIDTGPFGPYARPLVPDETGDANGLREAALASPFARGMLVSDDGRMLLAAVQLETELHGDGARERRVLAELDALLRPEFASLGIQLAGSPVFNRALSQLNRRDNALFTPLVLAIIALALLALFRSAVPALLALAVLGASVVWTLGAMGWLGVPMNITTSLLPPLLMVIAVADGIHVLSGYVDELGAGHGRAEALSRTLREVAPACLWTSLTTALGFASLLSVRIESVRSFAAFAALGVAIALLHSLVLLPALLVRAPLERAARRRPPLPGLGWLARAARRPGLALALALGPLVAAAFALPHVEVATHDGEFFRASHPINRAYRLLEARLGGVTPFELELVPPPGTPLRSAETVRAARALQAELASVPELTAGTSIADLLLAATPELDLADSAAVERSLFLVQALAPEEVRAFLHDEPARARISARALAMTSARSSELLGLVRERAAQVLPPGWSARATGLVPVFSQMEQYLVQGQLSSYGLAVLAIFAVFALGFRSLRLAAIALLVNTVPIALGAVLMALAGIRLDVATVMVASIALGIIDDDTVHLISTWRRGVERTGDAEAALAHAFDVAGRAIAVTSLILVAGFAALTLSGFRPTAHFGLLVCAAVAAAVLADLLILPAALLRLGGADRFRSSNAA